MHQSDSEHPSTILNKRVCIQVLTDNGKEPRIVQFQQIQWDSVDEVADTIEVQSDTSPHQTLIAVYSSMEIHRRLTDKMLDPFGTRQLFGKRYLSYWSFIKLNCDVTDPKTGEAILNKGDHIMAILAEDPDQNYKAKVLNPNDLFGSPLITLAKPAMLKAGAGDFDVISDVPTLTNYDLALKAHEELIELDRINSGDYDDLLFAECDGKVH